MKLNLILKSATAQDCAMGSDVVLAGCQKDDKGDGQASPMADLADENYCGSGLGTDAESSHRRFVAR